MTIISRYENSVINIEKKLNSAEPDNINYLNDI